MATPLVSTAAASSKALAAAAWDATLLDELLNELPNETDALLTDLLNDEQSGDSWGSPLLVAEELSPLPSPPLADEPTAHASPSSAELTPPPLPLTMMFASSYDKTKHTLHCLRHEVSHLTKTLKRLQSECNIPEPHVRSAMEAATAERLKRRRVEDECRQLREAVYAQSQFLRGLRSVFSTPLALSAMDLTHYLHNYTRLPRDRSTRWNEYAALAQEARLQSAMDLLCRETRAMALTDGDASYSPLTEASPSLDPRFTQTQLMKHDDGFGLTSTSVYALETNDLSAALRGVCVAARDIMNKSRFYECTSLKRQIVDPDALPGSSSYSNVHFQITGVDQSESVDDDELSLESRVVTLYKQTDEYAVVFWDFVDDDELHPERETTDVTRQAVGACLIRHEICDDGVERAVCRAMRTRRYRFHAHTSQEVLTRFESVVTKMMKVSDLVFRGIALDSIAKEEAAYAQAVAILRPATLPASC